MADEEEKDQDGPSEVIGTKTLGVERWVQFGYIATFAFAMWLFDKIVRIVWDQFAEPDEVGTIAGAALIALIITFALYKSKKVNRFGHEAAGELSKVTWPTRKETWHHTVVVVITSFIAAIILFGFDAAWSAITDLIYKV